MKIAKLLIAGDYEDAFLYKGTLVAIKVDRSFEFFDLLSIVDDLQERLQEGASFLPMLFLQNHWLRGQQFDAFMHNDAVYASFKSFLDLLPETLTVDSPQR